MKARAVKIIRNLLIWAMVLLVLLVGGGVAYTWYMGQNTALTAAAIAKPVEVVADTIVKHVQPSEKAKESAAIQFLTSPLLPGSNASVVVKTNPYSECKITVEYNKIASTDSGLGPKTADDWGTISWTWTVEDSVPLGKWPVKVTCTWSGRSAVVIGDLTVVAQLEQ